MARKLEAVACRPTVQMQTIASQWAGDAQAGTLVSLEGNQSGPCSSV